MITLIKIFAYAQRNNRKNYADALEFCGAEPIFSEDISKAYECQGLLLPGGGDVSPNLYGQNINGSINIDNTLDETELKLVDIFSNSNKPILGICRGMQIINVAFGGDLIQHIKTSDTHTWKETTGDKVHSITADNLGFIYSLYSKKFSVNSAHHQAVNKIAQGFSISATADDGIIEAIENRKKKIIGVQWHPERMAFNNRRADTEDGRLIFEYFLSLCN